MPGGSLKSKPMWRRTSWVLCLIGFLLRFGLLRFRCLHASLTEHATQVGTMNQLPSPISQKLAELASASQEQRTGHAPQAVTVVLSDDTLVFTLQDALTPAEKALAKSADGAVRVQEFHRQLFANSIDGMRQEIARITGRQVREAAAEVETAAGTMIHAFTTGAMVQVFLLAPNGTATPERVDHSLDRATERGTGAETTFKGVAR
jgi:uncharacterized protein YbcI